MESPRSPLVHHKPADIARNPDELNPQQGLGSFVEWENPNFHGNHFISVDI